MIEPCEEVKRVEQRYEKALDDMEKHYKDVLDKIRAEIEEQKQERCFDDDEMFAYRTGLDDAIYIVDKYKAETEVEE